MTREERTLRNRLYRSFQKQINWIVREAENLRAFREQAQQNDPYAAEISMMLSRLPEKKSIVDAILASMKVTMLAGGKRGIKAMKLSRFGITFDLKNKQALRILEEKKTLELSNYRGNIDGTTKKAISKILLDAANAGTPYTEVSKLIQEQGKAGVFSQARGELIAIQETGRAYGDGNKIVVDDFKAQYPSRQVMKHWVTVGDDRVRDEHLQNEKDGWIPSEQLHSGTGEPNAPSTDFRCRCFEEYQIE